MKNLQKIGVQELGTQEMKESNGGGYLPGWYKILVECLIEYREEISGAYAQTIREGGKVCTDMPFK